jgi:putative CocE/NonD family hydrolase
MAEASRCAAPAALSAALLLIAVCTPVLNAQTAGQATGISKLEKLSGAYASSEEPDVPVSFYVQNGKLTIEAENSVPMQLTQISDVEFAFPGPKAMARFTMDDAGQGKTLTFSGAADIVYTRAGPAVHHVFHDYQRTEEMVPMRDGVKLHLVILKPADIAEPLPFLMQRTPYGCNGTSRASFFSQRPELARDGYIYVCGDIRGRYDSKGEFVMSRPMADHHNLNAVDESTDTYDTIAWLLKNVPGNNGRVGLVGTSYPGFLAMAAGIDPHPAVRAISPQAPMIDVWMGDDFFHNGAFRQSYGYDYVYTMEQTKERRTSASYGESGDSADGFDYFLKRGSFEEDVKQSGSKMLPTWELFLAHPAYDSVWSSRAVEQWMDSVTVPTLSVGGYYDQEDMYGPQAEYARLEPHDKDNKNFLVLGPWRHGYWAASTRDLGALQFGEPIGKEFRERIEAKFFAHFLKDEPGTNTSKFDLADTASFQTGSNTWKYYRHFPPSQSEPMPLYLTAGGRAAWEKPEGEATTAYTSDPADPVPYRHRPIQPTYSRGSEWYNWLTEDQRFVTARKDVAVWKLLLTKDLTLTGEVVADIFAATTGSDNDMVVKLIDQYPDDDADAKMRGYQLMTNSEIFRGRYLNSFEKPAALKPGEIREYKFSLHGVDHVFKAGHTVMVEIQSTWFPLYDRNPQTFVPNIMKAKQADYKAATITVYTGPGHESRLMVPVMNKCEEPDCN